MKRRLVMAVLLSALAAGACGAAEEPARGSIRDREEKEEETKEPETTSVPVQSTEPTEAPTETPVETPVEEEEVHALQVDIENLYDGWSNDDYTVYASLLTPEITLKSEGYDKLAAALNSYGKELQDRGSKEDLPGMINMAKEYEPYADPDGTVGFVTEYNTTAVRADSVAVSLLTSNYIDAHGAHPGYVYMTRNFDSKTGAELSVYDVINADQIDRLPDIIADVLLQYYDPMIFNSVDDLPGTISDMLGMNGDLVYTLGYDGISFYFSPYDLASYAAGEQIATILYDDMPELVKPEYREAPENYIRALSSYGKNLLPDGRILELSIYSGKQQQRL